MYLIFNECGKLILLSVKSLLEFPKHVAMPRPERNGSLLAPAHLQVGSLHSHENKQEMSHCPCPGPCVTRDTADTARRAALSPEQPHGVGLSSSGPPKQHWDPQLNQKTCSIPKAVTQL